MKRNGVTKVVFGVVLLPALMGCSTNKECEHDYSWSVVIKDPTCEAKGIKLSQCKLCKEMRGEEIDALGHDYEKETVNATCISKGYDIYKCSRCDSSYQNNETDFCDHSYGDWNYLLDATKYGHGLKYKKCSVCNDTQYELVHNKTLTGLVTTSSDITNPGIFNCGVCNDHETIETVTYEDLGMPILSLTGSMDGISKDNKITINYSYDAETDYSGSATLKWQGSSSVYYPKKNFNINFLKENGKKNKVVLNETWGKQSKYTLKANYVDYSGARNVVSGKIYGDIAKTRDIEDEYKNLVNGGAIDGFPIFIFINGAYQGLYTLNVPKDDWLFDMDDEKENKQAIWMAKGWTSACSLSETVSNDDTKGFDLEYCSTDDTSWVYESWNNFVNFLNNSTDEEFKNGIADYTSVERAMDAHIYTTVLCALDNTSKNIIWTTYDGIKWTPTVYDMDDSWGLYWNGDLFDGPSNFYFDNMAGNKLYSRLWSNYKEEYITRYKELRQGALSLDNIEKEFQDFFNKIPAFVYAAESERWLDVPNQAKNNYS